MEDDFVRPLGGKNKKISERPKFRFPFFYAGLGLLCTFGVAITIWKSFVDDPYGGEPLVVTSITEPKFTNGNRSINSTQITELNKSNEPVTLTELIPKEDDGLSPIDPSEIIVRDPDAPNVAALSDVPDQALIEKNRIGFLPKISSAGLKPMDLYARPKGRGARSGARIALIIGGLGLNAETSKKAIEQLPPEISLAFAPYSDGLQNWMSLARNKGHELLVQLPLEPFDYPNNDPGPKTLLTEQTWDKNRANFHWTLSRMTNYVGVMNYMGARFSASKAAVRPVFDEIRDRGLIYIDDGSTPLSRAKEVAREAKTSFAQSALVLDGLPNADDIDSQLLELESLARLQGAVVGVANAYPITIERIQKWVTDAGKRGITLIPITGAIDSGTS